MRKIKILTLLCCFLTISATAQHKWTLEECISYAQENNINMFEVKIAVTVPDSIKIRAGYSANADVITEQRIDVLCIPESTIEFKEDKKIVHILTSKEDDKEQVFEEREIETGISDGINIEIIKGLTAKDKIRN